MNSHNSSKKNSTPVLKSTRLLDQLREQIRYLHYSLSTEEAYVYWVKKFIFFHDKRHPRDMGQAQVEAFLSYLAVQRKVSASTHRQAVLGHLQGQHKVVASLLYGCGLRLMEGLRLRVKDVDFDRKLIIVRDGKGGKDRVVMLPISLIPALKNQFRLRAGSFVAASSSNNTQIGFDYCGVYCLAPCLKTYQHLSHVFIA